VMRIQHVKSLGFLSQENTFVMYSDLNPHLCIAPSVIDVAVWCDFFSMKFWPHDLVHTAFEYFFLDETSNNWWRQLEELKLQAQVALDSKGRGNSECSKKKRVRIRPEEKTTEWAIPSNASVICAGLALLKHSSYN
jgi:hypothetical protein